MADCWADGLKLDSRHGVEGLSDLALRLVILRLCRNVSDLFKGREDLKEIKSNNGIEMGTGLEIYTLIVLGYQQAYHTMKLWGSCGALHSLYCRRSSSPSLSPCENTGAHSSKF